MNNREQKDYRELLIELYKKNQTFLNIIVLTMSSLTIPFLLKEVHTQEINVWLKTILITISFGYYTVITLYILSFKYAMDGCDAGLSNEKEKQKESEKLFETARKYDRWGLNLFLSNLFLVILAYGII